MPANHAFQLQDGDIDLLHYIFQLRLATIDHLSALSGRSMRALWGRLLKLRQRRYLSSATRFMQKRVYGLGTSGVEALVEAGYAPTELVAKRLRHRELSEIGIRHSLFIADIHTRILLLTRTGPVSLSQWTEGQTLWDTVSARDGAALPIRPDAYFTLKHANLPEPKRLLHVFLEADRSTMAHTKMAAKINGYLAYHSSRGYVKKYPDMQTFRVATVTQTESRSYELIRDLHPLIPRPAQAAYPFIPFDDLVLSSLAPQFSSDTPPA